MQIFVFIVEKKNNYELKNKEIYYMHVYTPTITQEALLQTMILIIGILSIVGCVRYLIRKQSSTGKKIFDIILLFWLLGENFPIIGYFYQGGILFLFALGYLTFSISILLYLIIFRKRVYPKNVDKIIEYYGTQGNDLDHLTSAETGESSEEKILPKVKLGKGFYKLYKYTICPVCNKKNLLTSSTCKYCLTKFARCNLCQNYIGKEDVVYCPSCKATYHKLEFLEWLKVKAFCVRCKKELDLWEFQKYLEENKQEGQLPSKFCINCGRYIPIDANFCIYCGLKF